MLRLLFFLSCLVSTASFATDFSTRIIGGQPAETGEWPTMVQLFEGDVDSAEAEYFCGGTLISDQWVLTAAHCFYGDNGEIDKLPTDVFVIAKSSGVLGQGQKVEVSQIFIHEQYAVANQYDSDIALMELESVVNNPALQSFYYGEPGAGCMADIVGWGATSSITSAQASEVLKDAEVPVVEQSKCVEAMGGVITGNMFCAGFEEGGTDTCPGDSGGPIFIEQDNEFRQIGITSWGPSACGTASQYGVYTRLSQFEDWVMAKTGLSSMVSQSGEACEPPLEPEPEPSEGGGSWGLGLLLGLLWFRRRV